jgi:hypothetical protein
MILHHFDGTCTILFDRRSIYLLANLIQKKSFSHDISKSALVLGQIFAGLPALFLGASPLLRLSTLEIAALDLCN